MADEPAAVVDAAVEHGVDGLLWDRLTGVEGSAAAAVRALLDSRARAAAARELFVRIDLERLFAALGAAAVPTLAVKGTALAYTVYPQPWLRPRTDTDLLVRHGDVASAAQALEACGYARSAAVSSGELVSHQLAFERDDAHGVRHVVDLHWKIVNPQMLANALTFELLWPESRPAAGLGPRARVPATAASVALACVHRLAHHQGHDRLIWLYDIDLLAAALTAEEWRSLEAMAVRGRIAGLCLDGLSAARAAFGTRIPKPVEAALAAAAPTEPSHAYVTGPVTRGDVLRHDLAALPSWRARAQLMVEHAFPPAAFMQQRYGGRARWMLPALYVHRLVTGASRWVRS